MSQLDQGLLRALREVGFDVSSIDFEAKTPDEWRALGTESLQKLDGLRLLAVLIVILSLVPRPGQERLM